MTRFKRDTRLEVTAELDVPEDGEILSDRIGLLPARQARSRENPFADPVREVRVRTESGKIPRIPCNDLDAGADEIAELHKRRWAIELFPDRVGDRSFAGASKPRKSSTSSAPARTPYASRSRSPPDRVRGRP